MSCRLSAAALAAGTSIALSSAAFPRGEWPDGPNKAWFENLQRPDNHLHPERRYDPKSLYCCGVCRPRAGFDRRDTPVTCPASAGLFFRRRAGLSAEFLLGCAHNEQTSLEGRLTAICSMRRREFIALLGGAAVAWPLAASAQQAARLPRIGILDFFPSATSADSIEAFQQGLRELGHLDGRNIHVEYHSAEQRSDLAATIATDLVRREVDIIVAIATPAAHAAKNATATIPIVMQVSDPLATGLVASLARPGGNLTGVSSSGPDLAGKRLELLRELRPELARVAFLGAANDPNVRTFLAETQAAADSTRVRLQPVLVTRAEEFDAAFATMLQDQAQGLIVQPLFVGHRAKLAELATRHRLPMVADQRTFVAVGGLAAYGVNRSALSRRWAYYVDKILKGAKPADLPIELPTTFELVINLKTAKALGIDVPPALLARADEVIE